MRVLQDINSNGKKYYAEIDDKNIFDLIYPVGSIYMSVNSTNPSTLFGGTWEEWGSGRVPLAFGNNGTTNYSTVEATGGFEKIALSVANLPAHTHGSRSLTGSFAFHGAGAATVLAGGSGITAPSTLRTSYRSGGSNIAGANSYDAINVNATHEHDSVGSGTTHDNMQPYIVCYMWKRTA